MIAKLRRMLSSKSANSDYVRKKMTSRIVEFRQCKRGAVLVEYAISAIVFFTLILVVFDIALISFAESLIGKSIIASARKAQIGDYAGAADGPEQFRASLCEETLGIFDCDDFHIVVRVGSSFAMASSMISANPVAQYAEPERFDFGDPEDIVLLRVMYPWSTLVIDPRLAGRVRYGDDSLLTATAVIRNEPADPS